MTALASRRGLILGMAALPALGTAAATASPLGGTYAQQLQEVLQAYAEDRACRPIGGRAKNGSVEEKASSLVLHRLWGLADEFMETPFDGTLGHLAGRAIVTAIIWEANASSEPHELCAQDLIRDVMAFTGATLPDGHIGFNDEEGYSDRDWALHREEGSLPAWAIEEAKRG